MTETNQTPTETSDMKGVHRALTQALAPAGRIVASAAGDDQRRAIIANYYDNVVAFIEAHHDGEEEILFPLLVERAPDQRDAVERATRAHAEVVDLLASAEASIKAWSSGTDPDGVQLAYALDALNVSLSNHLEDEEAAILPLASQYVTSEEWATLPGHAMRSFGGDKLWLVIGMVRDQMSAEQQERMSMVMPPPLLEMWETVGERSYNELTADLLG
jgi:hemerythrin-like domain-containing protein